MSVGLSGVRAEGEDRWILGDDRVLEVVGEAELPPNLEDRAQREGSGRGDAEKPAQAVGGIGGG